MDAVVAVVHRDAQAGGAQRVVQLARVIVALLTDRQHADLFRCKPERERAGEVFDQATDESFHTSERCAVDHHRAMLLVVRAVVGEVEADRQVVVHLHGAKLPTAADDILDDEVNLWSVERSFAGLFAEWNAERLGGSAAGFFGLVPVLGVAHILGAVRVAQTNAHAVLIHTERAEDQFDQAQAAEHFFCHLVFANKEMRVILREAANAGHAADFAGLFPAIDGAEFGEAHGHVAVAVWAACEDANVMRAVHRLQEIAVNLTLLHAIHQVAAAAALFGELAELVMFHQRRILALAVIGEVTAGAVQIKLADVRREDLAVALLAQFVADECLQLLANDSTVGRPQDQALADHFINVEEAQLLTEHAVIALLGFVEQGDVRCKFFLRGEGGSVHAGEAIAGFVAFPIAGSEAGDFERADLSGGWNVRSAA